MMFKRLLPFLLTGLVFITACKPDNDETPTPQKTCRLTDSQSITLYPNGSKDTVTSHYEYNNQGSMISVKQVSSGGTTTNGIYTYDSRGFLSGLKTTTDGNNTSLSMVTYTYVQDKLSRTFTVYESATEQYTSDYNYNTDGKMTYMVWQGKYFLNDGTNLIYKDSILNFYTDRKLTEALEYRERDQFAYTTRYTIETDANGRVLSRSGEDGNVVRYQYNADGEVTRQDSYYNNKLIAYTEYEYDTKKDIGSLTTPIPNGHIANMYGINVHNILKYVYYSDTNPAQTLQQSSSYLYEYEYNEQGYPTKKIQKYTYNGQTRITTTTYNITCQ
ncbi:hypothetical protein QNI16_06975 [Cytophagaceae bacterium YF14B1]|uniref:YD repeat-containing protein n=1 Tax=Xanthocytophaga flava TaxID=3048013 RepID=A0AAE3QNK9_9BACT|nr:hypothetical protein [Xanthocytophaga flavus]MDJ1480221.1 hypothetical protein [Xanthocytophaga flavus]